MKTRCINLVCRDVMWLFACMSAPDLVQGGGLTNRKPGGLENLLLTDIT